MARYRGQFICPSCDGDRLKPASLAYKVNSKSLPDLWKMPAIDLIKWFKETKDKLKPLPKELKDLFKSVEVRLEFMVDLGLDYLTLNRLARTLSGGETQRVNLAAALGSELVSTHFILDEPSVGLHPRDTNRLISAISKLQKRGNSLLVVEHDLDFIESADQVIELGPKAGEKGGDLVFKGKIKDWKGIDIKLGKISKTKINKHKKVKIKKY